MDTSAPGAPLDRHVAAALRVAGARREPGTEIFVSALGEFDGPALLAHAPERMRHALGTRAQLFLHFAERRVEHRLAGFQRAFGQLPGADIPAPPIWPAGADEQHFRRGAGAPVQAS